MARPQKVRRLLSPPLMVGFKPFGMPRQSSEAVKITFEEYESIKLVNYDRLSQDEAASLINVSRPTFTRIYNRALKSIAEAFVEGKAIEIGGGNGEFDTDWYRCSHCHKLIAGLESHFRCSDCKYYSKSELKRLVPVDDDNQ
ncbi:MAG: DUF134 domain-containing protein [Saprospiraceae bacterium]